MKTNNIAKEKALLLQKQALSLLPKDKQNIQAQSKILSIQQWLIGQTQINLLETDTVSSSFLLSQKWPFQLLKGKKDILYAFMAGNDTLAKTKISKQKKFEKSLLNLSLLFQIKEQQQPFISMFAANSILQSLKIQLERNQCQLPLHIRWKHDILLQNLKIGEISLRNAKSNDQVFTQLNIQINVKNIPKNFGAYDFQPTYLQKYTKHQINLKQLAEQIIGNFVKEFESDQTIDKRKGQIKNNYQQSLIYLGQKVTIYDQKYEHIHYTGKFIGVNQKGEAILEGFNKFFNDGVMKFNCEAKDYLNLYRGDY